MNYFKPNYFKPELLKPELLKPELLKPELLQAELLQAELLKPNYFALETPRARNISCGPSFFSCANATLGSKHRRQRAS